MWWIQKKYLKIITEVKKINFLDIFYIAKIIDCNVK